MIPILRWAAADAMRRTLWVFVLGLLVVVVPSVPAENITQNLHVNLQFTNASGKIENGTWNLTFNLSRNAACTDIVWTNSTTVVADSRGIVSLNLENITGNFSEQLWLGYERNGTYKSCDRIAYVPYAFTAGNVSAGGVQDTGDLNLSNHTASFYNLSIDDFWITGRNLTVWLAMMMNFTHGNLSFFYNDKNFTNWTNAENIANSSIAMVLGTNATPDAGGVNFTHLSNYSDDINATHNQSLNGTDPVHFGSMNLSGDLMPDRDNTYDIGDNNYRWMNFYAYVVDTDRVQVNDITADGDVILSATGSLSVSGPATMLTLNITKNLTAQNLTVIGNITDGTRFVTVQNLSDAANVTLNYARINATIGTNATFVDTNTITDPAGLYTNSSLPPGGVNFTDLSNFTNNRNFTNLSAIPGGLTLRNFSNDMNYTNMSAWYAQWTNWTYLSNFTNDRNMTNVTDVNSQLVNFTSITNLTNGTTHLVSYSNLTGDPPNFTQGINVSNSLRGEDANFTGSVNTTQVRGLDFLNFSNNVSIGIKNASCIQLKANETIFDFCK